MPRDEKRRKHEVPQNLGSAFVPKEAVFNNATDPSTWAMHPRPPHCMKPPGAVPKLQALHGTGFTFLRGPNTFSFPPPVPGEMAVWIITVLNCWYMRAHCKGLLFLDWVGGGPFQQCVRARCMELCFSGPFVRDTAIFQLEAIWDARMGLLEVPEGGHLYPSIRNGWFAVSGVDTGISLLWGGETVDVGNSRCKPSVLIFSPSHYGHFSPNEGVIRSKMKTWPLFFGGRYCLQCLICPLAVWSYRLVLAWCILRTKHVFPPSFLSCLPNSCLEQTSFVAPSDKQSSAPNTDVEVHLLATLPTTRGLELDDL